MSVIVFYFDFIFNVLRIDMSRNMFRLVTGHPFEVFVVKILLTGPGTTVFLGDFTKVAKSFYSYLSWFVKMCKMIDKISNKIVHIQLQNIHSLSYWSHSPSSCLSFAILLLLLLLSSSLLFLDICTFFMCLLLIYLSSVLERRQVSVMHRPLCPWGKRPRACRLEGWVDPTSILEVLEKVVAVAHLVI